MNSFDHERSQVSLADQIKVIFSIYFGQYSPSAFAAALGVSVAVCMKIWATHLASASNQYSLLDLIMMLHFLKAYALGIESARLFQTTPTTFLRRVSSILTF